MDRTDDTTEQAPTKPHGGEKPRARALLAANTLNVLAGLTILFTLVGFAGGWLWLFDLFSHFRVQYAIVAALLAGLSLWAAAWRSLALCLLSIALNLMVVVPLYVPREAVPLDTNVPPLKVAGFNVRKDNQRYHLVCEYVLREQPDLVVLAEVDDAWQAALTKQLEGYRMAVGRPQDNTFGIALFVRDASEALAIETLECRDITGGVVGNDSIVAELRWHDRPLALLGVHTVSPRGPDSTAARNAQFRAAADWSRQQQSRGRAAVVLGDFNSTPWSAAFARLLREGGLLNSQQGFGVQPSFMSRFTSPLAIPIDHCLHSPQLRTVGRRVDSRTYGSDHRPLAVELAWVKE